jgi:hypothetical protein
MARVRRPGPPEIPPPTRGPEGTALAALLGARRFRLGAGAERVARNLAAHGGESAADAAAWIGVTRPPPDAPSVSLGEAPGTLGPRSFGFLNNVGGVAAFDAPLTARPRPGGLALVATTREALPDLGPLVLGRGLGISWIISVGDGDPAEALAFLAADPATTSLAVVLGAGASGATLRSALGAKPSVLWGGDALCRAVARRAGASLVDGLDGWLAQAARLDAGLEPGAPLQVVVVGGGRAFVEGEVRAAGLDAPVLAVDERAPAELDEALAVARREGRSVVLVAAAPPPLPGDETHLVRADLAHPAELRALLLALGSVERGEPARGEPALAKARAVDKELAARVRAEVERELSDHDAKRLLKAWGARVTRQAPTPTPTGAVKLAKEIGVPVLLVCDAHSRRAESVAEVRQIATLLLQSADGPHRSVMVRECFPEAPRARARIAAEKGLGLVLRVGEACALLPLTRADAEALAAATAARRAADQRALAELLGRIAACAVGEGALFELELYVGAEPAVLTAKGELRR